MLFTGSRSDATDLRAGGSAAAAVCGRLGLDAPDVDLARVSADLIPGLLYVPQPRRPGASVLVVGAITIDF